MPLEARTGILKQSELQDQPWLKGGDINSNSWHEEMWSYISEGMGSEKGKELQPLFFSIKLEQLFHVSTHHAGLFK